MHSELHDREFSRFLFALFVLSATYLLNKRSKALKRVGSVSETGLTPSSALSVFRKPAQKSLRQVAISISEQLGNVEKHWDKLHESLTDYVEKKAAHLDWRVGYLADIKTLKELQLELGSENMLAQIQSDRLGRASLFYSDRATFYVQPDTKPELEIAEKLELHSQEITRLSASVDAAKTLQELEKIASSIEVVHENLMKAGADLNSLWEQLGEEKRHFTDEGAARVAESQRRTS